ncbi:hypothetical protein RA27_00960 [Ruegeria sp. ANG-R]|uniref:hypothetical protein n=1 Tax=Ruegeria sp. ANG-R TaxID=1577903 RepID=UPI00057E6A6F|nr:hypothetical protein [Ruegeria sp. ANG-R]KIC42011.1 hypothetical protein RA27_00960 [Ruegeria sp. ANG-R]
MSSPGDGKGRPAPVRPSLFLERQSYRRRRLADAARLLPFLGAAMLALPLLWPDESEAAEALPLSSAMFYIFACWGVLILISVVFGIAARRMAAREDAEPEAEPWQR